MSYSAGGSALGPSCSCLSRLWISLIQARPKIPGEGGAMMITLAVAILMLSSAFLTAGSLLQASNRRTERIPYFDESSLRGRRPSKWLYLAGIVLFLAGSFLYSQRQGAYPNVEFVVLLVVGAGPVVLVRVLHNRRVARERTQRPV